MILDREKTQEFQAIVRPVIEWLNDNCYPHVTIEVNPTGAELSEGVCSLHTMDYVKD